MSLVVRNTQSANINAAVVTEESDRLLRMSSTLLVRRLSSRCFGCFNHGINLFLEVFNNRLYIDLNFNACSRFKAIIYL